MRPIFYGVVSGNIFYKLNFSLAFDADWDEDLHNNSTELYVRYKLSVENAVCSYHFAINQSQNVLVVKQESHQSVRQAKRRTTKILPKVVGDFIFGCFLTSRYADLK